MGCGKVEDSVFGALLARLLSCFDMGCCQDFGLMILLVRIVEGETQGRIQGHCLGRMGCEIGAAMLWCARQTKDIESVVHRGAENP